MSTEVLMYFSGNLPFRKNLNVEAQSGFISSNRPLEMLRLILLTTSITGKKKRLIIETANTNWRAGVWDDTCYLVFNDFNAGKPMIGIEAWYVPIRDNALGKFEIVITTWTLNAWAPYASQIKEQFPNIVEKIIDDRVYLSTRNIENDDEEAIIATLKRYYLLLVEIVKDLPEES